MAPLRTRASDLNVGRCHGDRAAGLGLQALGRSLGRAVAAAMAVVAAHSAPVYAATFHVGSTTALEAAVASADASSAASTIDVDAGQYLPEATLTIKRDISIVGPSSSRGAVLGGSAVAPFPSDLFRVEDHAKLTLSNVEVTGAGGEGSAAAIDDFGSADVESSTIAGNVGTGLWVQPGATATVRNSTLSNGLDLAVVDDGATSLLNATVAANKGGGIENRGTLSLTNTIVAENKGPDCEGRANTSDHSLDSDGSCGVGSLSRLDPKLGRLAANGGSTPTQALESDSPAIGAADDLKCTREDQRHFARPVGLCDLGAYQTDAVGGGSSSGSGGGSGSVQHGTALVGVGAHGSLRGATRSRITFTVLAEKGHRAATFSYRDGARHVTLQKLTVSSLAIDAARGVATLRGNAFETGQRRRVRVTIVLVNHSGRRSLRIHLSSGYHESGALLGGSITFTRGAAQAAATAVANELLRFVSNS